MALPTNRELSFDPYIICTRNLGAAIFIISALEDKLTNQVLDKHSNPYLISYVNLCCFIFKLQALPLLMLNGYIALRGQNLNSKILDIKIDYSYEQYKLHSAEFSRTDLNLQNNTAPVKDFDTKKQKLESLIEEIEQKNLPALTRLYKETCAERDALHAGGVTGLVTRTASRTLGSLIAR